MRRDAKRNHDNDQRPTTKIEHTRTRGDDEEGGAEFGQYTRGEIKQAVSVRWVNVHMNKYDHERWDRRTDDDDEWGMRDM